MDSLQLAIENLTSPPVLAFALGVVAVLVRSDLLGCISERQAVAEIDRGLLRRLPLRIGQAGRRIGLTCRADWHPTRAQTLLLDHVRAAARAA